MLTYVINTSENKTFDSNLLFELVGYAQIRWKYCSLDKIELCAKEIAQEEKSKILDKGEYRVVVLVDFFDYRYTDAHEDEAAGEYVEIYKNFVEKYLLDRLFTVLKKNNAKPKTCEIYYIQYTEYAPLITNHMEKEQVARLLGLENEELRIHKERLKDARVHKNHLKHADDAKNFKLEDYEENDADILIESDENTDEYADEDEKEDLYDSFELKCTGDVTLVFDIKNGEKKTFNQFYEEEYLYGKNDARKSGIISHKPYVTSGDAGRAAYDALSLSLYLVKTYERKDNSVSVVDSEIQRPNDRKLIDRLKTSLRKIHSARNEALNNGCKYYKLDVEDRMDSPTSYIYGAVDIKKRKENKIKNAEDQYQYICRCAAHDDGTLDEDEQQLIDTVMNRYLESRDIIRSRNQSSIVADVKDEEMTRQFPSEFEFKKAIQAKKDKLSALLGKSLAAEYNMQDFSEEKQKADIAYDKYKRATLSETKTFLGDLATLFVMLIAMIVPYGALQYAKTPFTGLPLMLYGLACGIFGGIFVMIMLVRVFLAKRRIAISKTRLNNVYLECIAKKEKAVAALREKYETTLVEIENVRHSINKIYELDRLNRLKNQRVETHREMLENVENKLSGMLNSFGEKPDLSIIEDVHNEFSVEKPFTASENKVYKIFSIEAIDEMFEKRGGSQ